MFSIYYFLDFDVGGWIIFLLLIMLKCPARAEHIVSTIMEAGAAGFCCMQAVMENKESILPGLKLFQSMCIASLGNSKATAHFGVDFQCWTL